MSFFLIKTWAAQKPDHVNQGRNRSRHHKDARFGSQFAAVQPRRTGESNVEKPTHGCLPAVACADEKKLSEIKSGMPAHCPPERTGFANAQTKNEAEKKNHADIHCVLARFLQVIAGEDCCRDHGRRPKTGTPPKRLQRVAAKGVLFGKAEKNVCDEPKKREPCQVAAMQCQSMQHHR